VVEIDGDDLDPEHVSGASVSDSQRAGDRVERGLDVLLRGAGGEPRPRVVVGFELTGVRAVQ
jgi:hypothetical protein